MRYSLIAGEKALVAYAWEEAQNQFERGLVARSIPITGSDPLPDAESAALIFGFSRAQLGAAARGEMDEAGISLARAFDYYVGIGDTVRAIEVADYPVLNSTAYRAGFSQIIPRALTIVAPGSLSEGRLLARFGWLQGRVEANYTAAQETFNRALSLSREDGDTGLELRILTYSAEVDWFHFRLAESGSKSLECIELAVHSGDTYAEGSARHTGTRALMMAGEGAKAQAENSAYLAFGERPGERFWLVNALESNCQLACLRGDWGRGRELAQKAQTLAFNDPAAPMSLAMLEFETGNISRGEMHLDRLLEIMANISRATYCSVAAKASCWMMAWSPKLHPAMAVNTGAGEGDPSTIAAASAALLRLTGTAAIRTAIGNASAGDFGRLVLC